MFCCCLYLDDLLGGLAGDTLGGLLGGLAGDTLHHLLSHGWKVVVWISMILEKLQLLKFMNRVIG